MDSVRMRRNYKSQYHCHMALMMMSRLVLFLWVVVVFLCVFELLHTRRRSERWPSYPLERCSQQCYGRSACHWVKSKLLLDFRVQKKIEVILTLSAEHLSLRLQQRLLVHRDYRSIRQLVLCMLKSLWKYESSNELREWIGKAVYDDCIAFYEWMTRNSKLQVHSLTLRINKWNKYFLRNNLIFTDCWSKNSNWQICTVTSY